MGRDGHVPGRGRLAGPGGSQRLRDVARLDPCRRFRGRRGGHGGAAVDVRPHRRARGAAAGRDLRGGDRPLAARGSADRPPRPEPRRRGPVAGASRYPLKVKILVAPDSFGGALDSVGVAAAIAAGWSKVRPEDEVVRRPMADGGEGTLAAVAEALGEGAERRTVATTDAIGRPIEADWLLVDDGRGAFIELAAASGLARLAPNERGPESARAASTRGTGELVRAALDAGVASITIGLGGSATTDGGSGLLRALGVRFLDDHGQELAEGGAALARLSRVDAGAIDPRLATIRISIASDVTNPL